MQPETPPRFPQAVPSPARLDAAVRAYFAEKDRVSGRYGPSDLAAYLGLDRDAFFALLDDPDRAPTVRWAMTKIAGQLETGTNWDATRAVFLLKQRQIAGYSDKTEGRGNEQMKIRILFGDEQDDTVFL